MMTDLNYLLNCSIRDNAMNLSDYTFDNSTFKSEVKVFQVGTLSGLAIAMIIDILSFQYSDYAISSVKTKLSNIFKTKILLRTLVLTILVLLLPLIIVVMLLALIYKVLCSVVIQRTDSHFVGFLDSFDVFWSLENDAKHSVINVLGVVESESPYAIASNIKTKLQNILPNEDGTRKIFFRRNEDYGFYYWRQYSIIDMNEYVEIVEFTDKDDLDEADLEKLLADIQHQSLPYEDEGLFKILITRQRVGGYGKERGEYGIIFRIHHSAGDGVALIEFLCQTLADKSGDYPINMFPIPQQCHSISPYEILDMIYKLCTIPVCFADGILKKPDESSLHGPTLLGQKVFKWTNSDENLLIMVKQIKDNVKEMNFTDILATALSSGLRIFFSETMVYVPEDVAVILPVRFPKKNNHAVLTNDFSVTILDLPVGQEGNMEQVKSRCNDLRKSADPLTNYYFLKLVTSVLPKRILQSLLHSSQATMVFSNMPGPKRLSICGGNVLKTLVFFVPHQGTTGLCVTALSYGGVLRLAAMADTALVQNAQHLGLVLEGMVDEIKRSMNILSVSGTISPGLYDQDQPLCYTNDTSLGRDKELPTNRTALRWHLSKRLWR